MNVAKWIAEQKAVFGIGNQTFGLFAMPLLCARVIQEVVLDY